MSAPALSRELPTDRRMSVLGIANLLEWQAQLGVPADTLLADTGIDPALLRDPNATISVRQDMAFTRSLLRHNRMPALGLMVGQQFRLSAFGHLGMMLPLAGTRREAIELFIRYINLSYTHFQITLHVDGEVGKLSFCGADYLGELRPYYLARDMAFAANMARTLFGGENPLRITQATLAYAPAEERQAYADFFGVPVHHGRTDFHLLFGVQGLDHTMPHANPLALQLVEPEAARRQASMSGGQSWTQRVCEALAHGGPRQYPAMADLATDMHCTERTLRRHLQQEGSSYQGLLDEARGAMARHLLQHERWSVERVADALGYSESAAFSRAFSRWMGVSPMSYKKDSALRMSSGG